MASRNNTSASSGRRQTVARSNSDSARWIAGLLLLFIGLFVAASVFFSFFTWDVDQSILQRPAEERELLGDEVENLCGEAGARIGRMLVDNSFGVFGILLPCILVLVGIRIIRQRPLLLNHSILSLLLILILGSLTLGFAFGDRWSLCSSTGWGGAFGIGGSEMLHAHIGVVGTLILLLGGWILTGVFINRNFINTVNEAGNVMVDRSERIVETVRRKVVGHTPADEPLGGGMQEEALASGAAAPDAGAKAAPEDDVRAAGRHSGKEGEPAAPAAEAETPAMRRPIRVQEAGVPSGQPAAGGASLRSDEERRAAEVFRDVAAGTDMPRDPHPGEGTEIVRPAAETAGVAVAANAAEAGEESPFLELTPDGRPIVADDEAEPELLSADDGEFTEVDLSRSGDRVVMGRGGLVELARPSVVRQPVQEGPFTEITVGGDDSEGGASARSAVQETVRRGPSYAPRNDEDRPVFEEFTTADDPADAPEPLQGPGPDVHPVAGMPSETAAAPAHDGGETTQGVVVTVEAHEARMVDERKIPTESYDPLKDLVNYRKPPVTLLEDYISDSEVSDEEIFENKTRIEETLKYFGIPIQRIKATVGPTVTLYEIVQAQGVKISKIQGLQNDIAQSLKAESGIRIIAPIPGRGTIGIEVPNRCKQVVSMYSAIRSLRFQESKATLPVVIGRTIQNENFVFDLAKMPHLLVAGATGMGKSVGLNAIITSLLYRMHPAQLKFVMIDPKMVEFSLYAKIEKHFLAKMESEEEAIVTDPKKAVYTLNALCTEMDTRLELCKKAGARNIAEYNEKFTARRLNPMNGHRFLPYIVVVIDEFADLIMTAKEVEMPVTRLAQKARAIGIHLIVATQRPSVDVITGKIKANFPARIAFRVMQMIDSRTIIDRPGADQLIGRGDMLISKDGELTRIQCAFVDTPEVERIVDYISKQQGYTEAYALPDYTPESAGGEGMGSSEESSAPVKYDTLFAEIAREAVSGGQISTSMIQRNYEVGFNRAGRIMMQLERAGIVGRQQGAKPRDILFHDLPSLEAKLQELGLF